MKKYLFSLFAVLLTLTFSAPAFSAERAAPGTGCKSLIIFYSLSGNTKAVVEQLRGLTGADVLEIQTVRPYPPDFHAVVEQAREERRTNFLPPIQPVTANWHDYDTIYLGFPIWGNTIPQPMATYLTIPWPYFTLKPTGPTWVCGSSPWARSRPN